MREMGKRWRPTRRQTCSALLVIALLAIATPAAVHSQDAPKAVPGNPVKLPPPKARTTEAYGVDGASAVLAGVINPRGQPTVYWFQWGLTKSYGNISPEWSEEAWYGNEPREVEEALLDLRRNTTYHYRIVARNRSGKTFGGDRTFRTTP